MAKVSPDSSVIAGHQLMMPASTVNVTLTVQSSVKESNVLISSPVPRVKKELLKNKLVVARPLSAEILSATASSVIMSFQNVTIAKILSASTKNVAVHTNVNATETSAVTSVTVHVQKVSNVKSSMVISVAQLPSVFHVNTQQPHQLQHQRKPLIRLQLFQLVSQQQLSQLTQQQHGHHQSIQQLHTQPPLELPRLQAHTAKSSVHMSRIHQDVQLHVQPAKSVMVTSVSMFSIVHVSTRASLTKTVKSGRKITVAQAASAAVATLNVHQQLAMSLHANQVTTSILLMATVVQHVSEAIANVLIPQLVTNT